MPDIYQPPAFGLFAERATVKESLQVAAPTNGTPTSNEAARKVVATGKADSQRNAIAVYLWGKPEGATRHELAHVLGIAPDSVRPRVYELMGKDRHYRGEVVVVAKVDENGVPVRREYLHHGSSEVVVHVRFAERVNA